MLMLVLALSLQQTSPVAAAQARVAEVRKEAAAAIAAAKLEAAASTHVVGEDWISKIAAVKVRLSQLEKNGTRAEKKEATTELTRLERILDAEQKKANATAANMLAKVTADATLRIELAEAEAAIAAANADAERALRTP